jgi:hypothetical protein
MLTFLLLALLAPVATVPPGTPITVTGHQWAPFISPMGEPFRARTATDDTLADWFKQADRNRDGMLTAEEMRADAERFFAKLDTDHDGELGPDEIENYEYEIAPDIQVMSRTKRPPSAGAPVVRDQDSDELFSSDRRHRRRDQDYASLGIGDARQGAARYGLLNMPEPVAAADTDFNRGVSLEEFRHAAVARFQMLDSAHRGSLTLAQLQAMRPAPTDKDHRRTRREDADDTRLGNPLPTGP